MPTLTGHLDLTCTRDGNGRSYLREQSFSAPFHISKPYWAGDVLLLQLASPTPGLFGGDRLTSSVTLDEGARPVEAPGAVDGSRGVAGTAEY